MSGQVIEGNFGKAPGLEHAIEVIEGEWRPVIYAHDCELCDMCEEPYCSTCEAHYADCECPGPHQEDEYEYKTINGMEYARRLKDG